MSCFFQAYICLLCAGSKPWCAGRSSTCSAPVSSYSRDTIRISILCSFPLVRYNVPCWTSSLCSRSADLWQYIQHKALFDGFLAIQPAQGIVGDHAAFWLSSLFVFGGFLAVHPAHRICKAFEARIVNVEDMYWKFADSSVTARFARPHAHLRNPVLALTQTLVNCLQSGYF